MGNRNIVNGLALVGAIIVLIGVTFAADSALADEASDDRAVTIASEADERKVTADEVHRDAAEDAVDSIALDNELDLEISLADRTSMVVARAR